ncbi:hypothetical protein [Longimicrobium terrae]|uniref:Thioredoxin-like negative regulator of GroEL n=1 Tax=Longimicrobium terrae TaxID=1639882 RepID=A0A841H3M0_9BACT|nr:hypothetical protein [Longimicrobium terrae]MBB4638134.1 thioredoxin-like negative regulator of GroEL [Longimicrobium terrae]MBB6072506.1 thioredoxin-like negative regulator of GroEL [Longimicrobium terrae]NNC32084.1 hypothetical protein [Longimicrobium terrae]
MREEIKTLSPGTDAGREQARLELGEEMRVADHAVQRECARGARVSQFAMQLAGVQMILRRRQGPAAFRRLKQMINRKQAGGGELKRATRRYGGQEKGANRGPDIMFIQRIGQ